MALFHVDPVIHCPPPSALSPLKMALFLPLIWEFLGTDQVYDPVSLNQNKAERRQQETKTQCVPLSRLAVLFTVTNNALLILDTQGRKSIKFCSLTCYLNELMWNGMYETSSLYIKRKIE